MTLMIVFIYIAIMINELLSIKMENIFILDIQYDMLISFNDMENYL